jgi:hypothetical protein
MELDLAGDLVWDSTPVISVPFRAAGKIMYDVVATRKPTEVDGVPTEMRHEIDLERRGRVHGFGALNPEDSEFGVRIAVVDFRIGARMSP